ncbi:hypothetical protein MPH_02735 [Macrophomina phaseolina MS6]|uniref:Integral membrane protein n=1 Tax=Macrophomina phaseolina (strain MS6) TaxID=1126212 RepID=K2STH9_MACPH|nr:hypothetical protein MPH_02735 [Macrophomina phaseolina MS6]
MTGTLVPPWFEKYHVTRAEIFEFFFFVLVLWVIQIQVLLQIIINRIGLLHTDARKVHRMKWTVAGYVGIINVSVFCIWLPAQLQRSQTYIDVNHVWDRVEKVLFMLIDAGLNFYFMWLVRRNLIANGLEKYKALFWTNAALDVISVFLDLTIILSMSFKNPFIYVQFHPLAYTIKLAIEMSLANLIAKVARASSARMGLDDLAVSSSYDVPTTTTTRRSQNHKSRASAAMDIMAAAAPLSHERRGGDDGDEEAAMCGIAEGCITEAVAMGVRSERKGEGEDGGRAGSWDSGSGDSERWLRRDGADGLAEVQKAYMP